MTARSELDHEELVENADGEPRLVGQECISCDAKQFPPRERCHTCGSGSLESFAFDPVGTVETYSVVHVAPEGFDPPYPVGFVRLSPGNVRAFAPFDADPETLAIGDDARATVLEPGRTPVPEPTWGFVVDGGGGETS